MAGKKKDKKAGNSRINGIIATSQNITHFWKELIESYKYQLWEMSDIFEEWIKHIVESHVDMNLFLKENVWMLA